MFKSILMIILIITVSNSKNKDIYIKSHKQGNKVIAYVYNNSLHHITIKYDASIKNLISLCPLPTIKSFKPKSKSKICEFIISKNKFSYNSKYKWVLGTKNAVHDDSYLYRLPYELNTEQRVSQGFDGYFSHKNNSLYAVDFDMKEGVKVYASREGLVVSTKSDSQKGGNNKKFLGKANKIIIKHPDNTYAVYNHLKYNSLYVKTGDYVKRGDLLAQSGSTGYNNGAHLHLIVYKTINHESRESIPIKFKTKKGILINPIEGKSYISVK